MRYSALALSARADALCALLNGGTLLLLGGERPPSPDAPVTDAPLYAVARFRTPAFRKAQAGAAEALPLESGPGRMDGRPTWFRCLSKLGEPVLDGAVGVGPDSDAELVLDSAVVEDGEVRIGAMVYVEG